MSTDYLIYLQNYLIYLQKQKQKDIFLDFILFYIVYYI